MSKISKLDVISAIEVALEVEPGVMNEESCAGEFEQWDSVGLLGILVALDQLFEGEVAKISEMAEVDSVKKILAALNQHSLID